MKYLYSIETFETLLAFTNNRIKQMENFCHQTQEREAAGHYCFDMIIYLFIFIF